MRAGSEAGLRGQRREAVDEEGRDSDGDEGAGAVPHRPLPVVAVAATASATVAAAAATVGVVSDVGGAGLSPVASEIRAQVAFRAGPCSRHCESPRKVPLQKSWGTVVMPLRSERRRMISRYERRSGQLSRSIARIGAREAEAEAEAEPGGREGASRRQETSLCTRGMPAAAARLSRVSRARAE